MDTLDSFREHKSKSIYRFRRVSPFIGNFAETDTLNLNFLQNTNIITCASILSLASFLFIHFEYHFTRTKVNITTKVK